MILNFCIFKGEQISVSRFVAISFTALSALISWPFAVILGLPIVLEMLVVRPRELAFIFCNYALISGSTIIMALVIVDSYYFGKIVLVSLILKFSPNLIIILINTKKYIA